MHENERKGGGGEPNKWHHLACATKFSPSAMISSTVTWCRPTVKALPMKFPPAWLEPELPPPPPEPGPELTNSRRESKNFLMVSRRQEEDLWLQSQTNSSFPVHWIIALVTMHCSDGKPNEPDRIEQVYLQNENMQWCLCHLWWCWENPDFFCGKFPICLPTQASWW